MGPPSWKPSRPLLSSQPFANYHLHSPGPKCSSGQLPSGVAALRLVTPSKLIIIVPRYIPLTISHSLLRQHRFVAINTKPPSSHSLKDTACSLYPRLLRAPNTSSNSCYQLSSVITLNNNQTKCSSHFMPPPAWLSSAVCSHKPRASMPSLLLPRTKPLLLGRPRL